MKSIIEFWKKDIINKLIILVSMGLVISVGAFAYILFHLPEGSALAGVISLPGSGGVPTIAFIPTIGRPTYPPTPTTMFLPSATPDAAMAATLSAQQPTASAVIIVDTPTPEPTATMATPEPTTEPTTSAPTIDSSKLGTACIPDNKRQTGKVVEIVDGNTIRVVLDEKIYFVRYLGITVGQPGDLWGSAATYQNGKLVYGKQVTLISDTTDKDNLGRLLRYVLVNDTFVNLELVRIGLASPLDSQPDSACAPAFQAAEQEAKAAGVGKWTFTPTPVK